jgi:hypothetical protein
VRIARAQNGKSTKARDAADEAIALADACGDDRMRADALVRLLEMNVTVFLDPKLQKQLAATEAAVRKVAQPDLVARLDLVKGSIAAASGQWEECLKLAESAIRGFAEDRPQARLEAVQSKVRALISRNAPGDLKTARAEVARWMPATKHIGEPRIGLNLEALDVMAQWSMGDVAGANIRLPAIYARIEAVRRKPPEGDPISGTVVDAAGQPVANALVAAGPAIAADAVAIGYFGNFGDARVVTTDTNGNFTIDHVPKSSIIVAQAGDRRSRVRPAKDKDRLVLEPTTTVSGKLAAPDPAQLTVFVLSSDRDRSAMYQILAPVAADGSFTLSGVPVGKMRIGAVKMANAGGTQSFATQDITVGPQGLSGVVVKRADTRRVRVIVRSAVEVALSGAQVFVVSGTVQIKSVKEIATALRSPGMAIEVARPLTGETPPELGKLTPGDLVATLKDAPSGPATACALGLSGDMSDPGFREKLERHLDDLEVRCVPLGPDTNVTTIEVPPMKRID